LIRPLSFVLCAVLAAVPAARVTAQYSHPPADYEHRDHHMPDTGKVAVGAIVGALAIAAANSAGNHNHHEYTTNTSRTVHINDSRGTVPIYLPGVGNGAWESPQLRGSKMPRSCRTCDFLPTRTIRHLALLPNASAIRRSNARWAHGYED